MAERITIATTTELDVVSKYKDLVKVSMGSYS